MPVAPASSPSRPLITDADSRYVQAVQISKLLQSNRELRSGLRPEPQPIFGEKRGCDNAAR